MGVTWYHTQRHMGVTCSVTWLSHVMLHVTRLVVRVLHCWMCLVSSLTRISMHMSRGVTAMRMPSLPLFMLPTVSGSLSHFSTQICREAEAACYTNNIFSDLRAATFRPTDDMHATAIAAVEASLSCNSSAIVVLTTSGRYERSSIQNAQFLADAWRLCFWFRLAFLAMKLFRRFLVFYCAWSKIDWKEMRTRNQPLSKKKTCHL